MEDIWHALQKGAPFSFFNMAILAFSLAVVGERFYFLMTKYRVNAEEFMTQIRKLVQANNVDRAIKVCEAAPLPLLQVIKSGLSKVSAGDDAVIASMEETMGHVVPKLEARTPWLWTLANLATLVGLLGTIKGLITAFAAVGVIQDPGEKTRVLSEGIAEAMWNTFFGLLIAVICMFFHLILNTMTKKQKHSMEHSVMKLENLLTLGKKPGG